MFDFDSYELSKTWRLEPYHYGGILEPMVGVRWFRVEDTSTQQNFNSSRYLLNGVPNLTVEYGAQGDEITTFNSFTENEAGDVVRIVQTASYIPRGLFGLLYWYAVLPLHGFVFRGMLRGIRRQAEREVHDAGRPTTWRDPKVRSIAPERKWRRLTPGTALARSH